MVSDGQAWTYAILALLTVLAGIAARIAWPARRGTLPPQHVAAAAVIGAFAWEALASLPIILQGWLATTAGLGPFADGAGRLFLAASIVHVGASVAAVVGILRRHPWAIALGIGVGCSVAVSAILSAVSVVSSIGGGLGDGQAVWYFAQIAQRSVPALGIVALLAWPSVRANVWPTTGTRPPRWPTNEIVEVDPSIDVADWPDSTEPADGRSSG